MRPWIRIFSCALLLSALGGCTTGDETLVCTPVAPDTSVIACSIGWSCGDGVTAYSLSCSSDGANYLCQCNIDGVTASTITVSTFDCTSEAALPTATTGCGWNITVNE